LAAGSALGGFFIDNDAPARQRQYLNEKSGMLNEQFAQMLENTPDYAPWTSTAQNLGAGIVTTGIDMALGNMASKAFTALKGTTMLKNPTIKPSFINRIAPNGMLKTMFVRSFGDNVNKYEGMGVGGMAPVYALADASVSTFIEGMGGAYSENSAFKQGIKNTPKNFFKAWGKDILEESGEEVLQGGTSTYLESGIRQKSFRKSVISGVWITRSAGKHRNFNRFNNGTIRIVRASFKQS
jgi:hypothetical protein